ncbi:hypothetical protein [Streptomyces sp. S1D4-14]|uniref:hypothetical protein n=1 Tax=Streptomyces sp. S1D4-14 TaxID=2594461 RepID=UPI001162220A|nr:hypothetical protein [Streptomyces sp. S1D4-14]QDN64406.1 hypothetical protein FNV66_00815 [Streptomyces sp. S1D4-14]
MGHASHGGSCPLCGNYASSTATGKLYRHKGNVAKLVAAGRVECRASGATRNVAARLRANKDAGRHPHRNEDGTWLYVCPRCGREAVPQDVDPGRRCTPKGWEFCLRPPLQLPTKEARNEE